MFFFIRFLLSSSLSMEMKNIVLLAPCATQKTTPHTNCEYMVNWHCENRKHTLTGLVNIQVLLHLCMKCLASTVTRLAPNSIQLHMAMVTWWAVTSLGCPPSNYIFFNYNSAGCCELNTDHFCGNFETTNRISWKKVKKRTNKTAVITLFATNWRLINTSGNSTENFK